VLAQQSSQLEPAKAAPRAGAAAPTAATAGSEQVAAIHRPGTVADDPLAGLLARAVAARAATRDETTRNPEPDTDDVDEDEDETRNCSVTTGPTYTPTGIVPVIVGGDGKKRAPFSFSATFATTSSPWWKFWESASSPDCCEVHQYMKWDKAYETSKGGPPHSGFGMFASAGTWYEDRDSADKRYGHRSGSHSDPIAGGGDEYTTAGVRDQLHGDTYNGNDTPTSPVARKGQYQFKLKVIDTCGLVNTVKATSPVITVNW
jgi:hypothetical protein